MDWTRSGNSTGVLNRLKRGMKGKDIDGRLIPFIRLSVHRTFEKGESDELKGE